MKIRRSIWLAISQGLHSENSLKLFLVWIGVDGCLFVSKCTKDCEDEKLKQLLMLAANFLHAKTPHPLPRKSFNVIHILCWQSEAHNKIWSTPGWWSLENYKHIWYSYFTQWRRALSVLIHISLSAYIPNWCFFPNKFCCFLAPKWNLEFFKIYYSVNLANPAFFWKNSPILSMQQIEKI
jgi:hypothetical protein